MDKNCIELEDLISEIEDVMTYRELSTEYLKEHGLDTGSIGEYIYGVTMVPAKYVLPYLYELDKRRQYDK